MQENIWNYIALVRQTSPLVHNITNYVVMNNTANALLAAGASPVMAHATKEVREMVGIAGALVINIGTLDEPWVESMKVAVTAAKELKKPWILDPVGAGATKYRNKVIRELLQLCMPTVIRGNASEIMAVAEFDVATKGVDSLSSGEEALNAARDLNQRTGAVVCISGAIDYIIDGGSTIILKNGHPFMAKVTGMGCTATALIGAFLAVQPENSREATVAAVAQMGVAGELAATNCEGPGSFQVRFLDALYSLTEVEFYKRLKMHVENAAIQV